MRFIQLPVGARFTLKRENDGTIYTKTNENKHNNATYLLAYDREAIVSIHGCSQVKVVE